MFKMSDNFSAINIKVNGQWVPIVVLKGDKGDSFRYENLTEEQLKELKKGLNVGELPSNVATIDKEGKVGNVYDKSQVVNLLETNSKNLANADLQIPAGTVRTLDVTGAKLNIKGLREVTSDNSYTKRLKMNNLGEVVSTTDSDITINVPDTINIQSKDITFANTLTSVNKVKLFEGVVNNVAVKQPKTLYEKYMQTITENLYTRVSDTSEWTKVYNEGFNNLIEWDNVSKNIKFIKHSDPNFVGRVTNFGMVLNKPFPMNKNWVFSFSTEMLKGDRGSDNFIQLGFARNFSNSVVEPQIGTIVGTTNQKGISISNKDLGSHYLDTANIIYTKIDKVLYTNVNTLYGKELNIAFDISDITEENLYFTTTGSGNGKDNIWIQPRMHGFKYFIDDRNIDLTERVDNEQNLQKIKEFKQKVATKDLVALQGSDWAIDKVSNDGDKNKSIIKDKIIEVYNYPSGTNTLISLSYTPNFKLPKNKNYYFKFSGSLEKGRVDWKGSRILGFTNSIATPPSFGIISSANDSKANVGCSYFTNDLNGIGADYTNTIIEIWKVDNLVNVRMLQGLNEVYNIVFDIDLCGDLRPSAAVFGGDTTKVTHTFGEYYIEE